MTTVNISKGPVVPTGQPLIKSLNRPHPRITPHRTTVHYHSVDETGSNRALSFEHVNQYNDIVKEDSSLTYRSLPPVKLSFKNSKTKFMKSPRNDDNSSRILKPHLTLKTHSPGHHVFTEGISRKSEIPHPSFALQQLTVPYSNLPDNVRIYKERDRFAFGVKANREDVVSPYKLTPKPKGLHLVDVQGRGATGKLKGIQLDVKGVKTVTEIPQKDTDKNKQHEIKSNVIRLDPILSESEHSCQTSATTKDPIAVPTEETLAPTNPTFITENTKGTLTTENTERLRAPGREGRLSVVSIGDEVTAQFLENHNKKMRQLYPIYDHKTKCKETYKKMKFKTNTSEFQPSRKPKPLPETFTYKISTRSIGYGNEAAATNVKPIRNNLSFREKSGRFYDDSPDADRKMRDYFEPKLRKYYAKYHRKGQYRPRSADSDGSSMDMSHVPANPPPSEISHIFSEDMGLTLNEHRIDMLTVHEERTQTADMLSDKRAQEAGIEQVENDGKEKDDNSKLSRPEDQKTAVDNHHEPGNVGLSRLTVEHLGEKKPVNDNETVITDTDILMDKVIDNAYRVPANNISDDPGSVTDRYPPIPEVSKENTQLTTPITIQLPVIGVENGGGNITVEDAQPTREIETLSVPSILTDSQTQVTDKKLIPKINPNKQCLPVPTVSLDKLSHHPLLPNIKERTSLSRSLQNMTVSEQKLCDGEGDSDDSIDPDRLSLRIKDVKTSIPVTKLRLFSGSTCPSMLAPSLNITDDFGEEHRLVYEEFYGSEKDNDQDTKRSHEKKLVSSSNLAFISPLKFEARAKRQ